MNEVLSDAQLIQHCRDSIARGSKTFVFASKFFGRDKMADAALLYQWCRHCDDAIDSSPPGEQMRALVLLRERTEAAVAGHPPRDLSFRALGLLVRKHQIPALYPQELIEGMAMDADFRPFANKEDLLLYCYRVAGVVGLMMSHVMGVSDGRALRNACDLGLAMQLTNIARDVRTDFEMGRCYLPADLLARHGLNFENYLEDRAALARAVDEMLGWADEFYLSGEAGTRFLSLRSSLVILIARFTYARIGEKVRSAGARAWDTRQYTTWFEKLGCFARAGALWFRQIFTRARWTPVPIAEVWRLP